MRLSFTDRGAIYLKHRIRAFNKKKLLDKQEKEQNVEILYDKIRFIGGYNRKYTLMSLYSEPGIVPAMCLSLIVTPPPARREYYHSEQ